MRADALRRRAAIVDAARVLVAERSADVALDAVAALARVGIATLYRNFESRAELLDAVSIAILTDVEAAVAVAREELPVNPAEAWESCLGRLVGMHIGALTSALAEHARGDLSVEVREAQERTLGELELLLREAVAAGVARADISAVELIVMVGMIARPQPEGVLRTAPDLAQRAFSVLVEGLRPPRPRS